MKASYKYILSRDEVLQAVNDYIYKVQSQYHPDDWEVTVKKVVSYADGGVLVDEVNELHCIIEGEDTNGV
jgi:hypothetical protein